MNCPEDTVLINSSEEVDFQNDTKIYIFNNEETPFDFDIQNLTINHTVNCIIKGNDFNPIILKQTYNLLFNLFLENVRVVSINQDQEIHFISFTNVKTPQLDRLLIKILETDTFSINPTISANDLNFYFDAPLTKNIHFSASNLEVYQKIPSLSCVLDTKSILFESGEYKLLAVISLNIMLNVKDSFTISEINKITVVTNIHSFNAIITFETNTTSNINFYFNLNTTIDFSKAWNHYCTVYVLNAGTFKTKSNIRIRQLSIPGSLTIVSDTNVLLQTSVLGLGNFTLDYPLTIQPFSKQSDLFNTITERMNQYYSNHEVTVKGFNSTEIYVNMTNYNFEVSHITFSAKMSNLRTICIKSIKADSIEARIIGNDNMTISDYEKIVRKRIPILQCEDLSVETVTKNLGYFKAKDVWDKAYSWCQNRIFMDIYQIQNKIFMNLNANPILTYLRVAYVSDFSKVPEYFSGLIINESSYDFTGYINEYTKAVQIYVFENFTKPLKFNISTNTKFDFTINNSKNFDIDSAYFSVVLDLSNINDFANKFEVENVKIKLVSNVTFDLTSVTFHRNSNLVGEYDFSSSTKVFVFSYVYNRFNLKNVKHFGIINSKAVTIYQDDDKFCFLPDKDFQKQCSPKSDYFYVKQLTDGKITLRNENLNMKPITFMTENNTHLEFELVSTYISDYPSILFDESVTDVKIESLSGEFPIESKFDMKKLFVNGLNLFSRLYIKCNIIKLTVQSIGKFEIVINTFDISKPVDYSFSSNTFSKNDVTYNISTKSDITLSGVLPDVILYKTQKDPDINECLANRAKITVVFDYLEYQKTGYFPLLDLTDPEYVGIHFALEVVNTKNISFLKKKMCHGLISYPSVSLSSDNSSPNINLKFLFDKPDLYFVVEPGYTPMPTHVKTNSPTSQPDKSKTKLILIVTFSVLGFLILVAVIVVVVILRLRMKNKYTTISLSAS